MQRVILHCDMNNFYASVECMLNPELKNKPVAVCGSVEERHGIVLAKNYAVKSFGVSTGEAIWQAKQKCPELVIVKPHYEQYMKFSKLAREIYGRYTDQIEPYGMDECWLDVTGSGCLVDVDAEGNIRPRLIRWIDGRVYEIDRLKHKCRAASTKVGGCGIRYTVMIGEHESFLYNEDEKWFVEAKEQCL